MFISRELRRENICEYLLYMWEVEALLRYYDLDETRIQKEYVAAFPYEVQLQEREWLFTMARRMKAEGLMKKGHLKANNEVLYMLEDYHHDLLSSGKYPRYTELYNRALPYLLSLRKKGLKDMHEIEICFSALFQVMFKRIKKEQMDSNTNLLIESVRDLVKELAFTYRTEGIDAQQAGATTK